MAGQAKQAGRLSSQERNLDPAEQVRDTFASRLKPSLLPCPKVEKCRAFLPCRERPESRGFLFGEESSDQVFGIVEPANPLDIDADGNSVSYGDQGQIVRMSQVELKFARLGRPGQSGLAFGCVVKIERGGREAKISTQQLAQPPVRYDVSIPVLLEMEA